MVKPREKGMMGITTKNNGGGKKELKGVTQSMMRKNICSLSVSRCVSTEKKAREQQLSRGETQQMPCQPRNQSLYHQSRDVMAVFLTACPMDTMRCHFFSCRKLYNLNVIRRHQQSNPSKRSFCQELSAILQNCPGHKRKGWRACPRTTEET